MQLKEEFVRHFASVAHALSPAELDTALAVLEARELAVGDVLLTAGTPSDCAYLIVRGSLEVAIDVAVGHAVLGTADAGNWVGEVSLLDGGPATATVTAGMPARVLCLSKPALDELRKSSPRIATVLVREMTIAVVGRVRRASDRLEDLRVPTIPPPGASDSVPTHRRRSLVDALRTLMGTGSAS